MLFVKVPMQKAEPTRKKLLADGLFDVSHPVQHSKQFVFFPVKARKGGYTFVERKSVSRPRRPRSLKEALAGKLPADVIEQLVTSFDTIGDIAIIEVRHGMDEKMIGQAVLDSNPSIKVVCKKVGGHIGEFRLQPVEVIAGENRTTTIYKEHGVQMKVEVDKVYFSPRLSSERLRIAELVKPGEVIAGFFAGVGPFPLVIAKKKKCRIYAVELNPRGYELMQENIKLNRLKGEVIPVLGDVRELAQTLPRCDRVLMPAPKMGESFLVPCILAAKPGGIVHYYEFAPEDDLYSAAIARIEKAAASLGRKVEIINKRVVRAHAVRVSQVAIDFKVL